MYTCLLAQESRSSRGPLPAYPVSNAIQKRIVHVPPYPRQPHPAARDEMFCFTLQNRHIEHCMGKRGLTGKLKTSSPHPHTPLISRQTSYIRFAFVSATLFSLVSKKYHLQTCRLRSSTLSSKPSRLILKEDVYSTDFYLKFGLLMRLNFKTFICAGE